MFSEVFGEEEPSVAAASPAVLVDAQEAASPKSELRTAPLEKQKHSHHRGANRTGGAIGSSRGRPRVNGSHRGMRGGGRSDGRQKEANSSDSAPVRESHSGDSEPSADTSDSQEETESASFSSPERSDSEGAPRTTQKLWTPSKFSSATAEAALKVCDPWFAAAADGHSSSQGRDERGRLKILIDDIERALHNVAHGAAATAAASSAGAISAAERERGEDEASPFAVKVLSQLQTLKNLQRQRSEQHQHHQQKAQQTDCFLHSYQKSGALWILQRFAANLNCIVADEMGLGKTLQALAVYVYLRRFGGASFEGKPALVVCPLSVVGSWSRHCTHFLGAIDLLQQQQNATPRQQQKTAAAAAADVAQEPLRLLVFVGDAATRANIQRRVIDMQKSQQTVPPGAAPPFDILLTSYELAAREIGFLSQFCFSLLIIDEASRLKSPKGKKRRALAGGIKRDRTLLLAGTPIENSFSELFSLLQFLHPSLFLSSEAFTSVFYRDENAHRQGTGGSVARTPEMNIELLKRIVSTFVLRRTVFQAQHSWRLPPLREVVLLLPLTPLQRRLYLWLLTRDSRLILSSRTASSAATEIIKGIRNLNNLFVQLRKASNHPLLFRGRRNAGAPPLGSLLQDEGSAAAELQPEGETHVAASSDDEEGDAFYEKHLMSASNKLLALHQIVSFCLSRGEKIVVFSYSTNMLDLAEDLLLESGIRPARLDGNTSETDRRAVIEAFLRPPQMAEGEDEDDTEWSPMVLLLSVLAGGYGLNLVSSSSNSSSVCRCCVFLEGGGGGNPQVERQAIARLHRQGQTQPVIAIRLISKHTVEEVLYRRGSAKLRLSDNVLAAAVSAAAPAAAVAAAAAAAAGRAAEAEPLKSLQAFDCEVLSSSLLTSAEKRQATPETQRKEIAESLQFGAAALAAADSGRHSSSTKPDGDATAGETDTFSVLSIEPILTKAFSAGSAAAGGVPAAVAPAQSSKDTSSLTSAPLPPSPLAPLPKTLRAEAAANEERQNAAEEKKEAPEESIYYFEQQDFTPFVRRDRCWEDDAAVIEAFAASAAAAEKEEEGKRRGSSGKEMRRPPEEIVATRRLRIQRQRAERLEKLWASQNYTSLALRLAGEPSPHYFREAAAGAFEEAETRDKGEKIPAGDNKGEEIPAGDTKAEKLQLAIPAESFFVFPPLQHDEGFSGVSEHILSIGSDSYSSSVRTGADRYVHYRVGDATRPQSFLGAPDGPRIICLFVETGGRWVSGGFFKAVDQLSAMPRRALEKAKKCRDLRGGDVHLVQIRDGLFVALAVCINEEKRGKRGGQGFFVRVRDLLRCLRLLSIHCKRHRASLHLPRCSTPCRYGMEANMGSSSTNVLVFRLLQETFAKRKVHAVTYKLPRGDRSNTRGDTRGPQNGFNDRNPPRGGSPENSMSAAASSKNTTMQQRGRSGWYALRKKQMVEKQPHAQPNAEQQQQQQHQQAAKRHYLDETAQRGNAAEEPESICTRVRVAVSGEALFSFQSVKTKRDKGGEASDAGEMPGDQPVPQLAFQLSAPAASPVTVQQQPQQEQPQQTEPQQPDLQQQQPQKHRPKQLQQQGQVLQPYQQQSQKPQIRQPQRALRDCGVAWVLHESLCESVRVFLNETLKAAGGTVGLESADIHHAAGSFRGDRRADCCPLIYLIVGLNYLQEVLTLAQQQQEKPVMHAAFARLSASLVGAVENDKQLGRIATLWGFRGALLQLPWSSAFFHVSLLGEKGKKEPVAAFPSARLLRIRIEFSDYAEAAAASGCLLSPVEWRGGLKSTRDAWGEAASEADPGVTSAARESRDTKWERARVQIRKRKREALNAAATPMSIGRWGCFVEKAIPAELLAALQPWSIQNALLSLAFRNASLPRCNSPTAALCRSGLVKA